MGAGWLAIAQEDSLHLFSAMVEAGAIPATLQLLRHSSSATVEQAPRQPRQMNRLSEEGCHCKQQGLPH